VPTRPPGLAGAYAIQPVQLRLRFNRLCITGIREVGFLDGDNKVLGHLVVVEYPAYPQADLGVRPRLPLVSGTEGLLHQRFEFFLRGQQQRFPRADTLIRQKRIPAGDQAFSGVVWRLYLRQMLLIEQRAIQYPLPDQLPNAFSP